MLASALEIRGRTWVGVAASCLLFFQAGSGRAAAPHEPGVLQAEPSLSSGLAGLRLQGSDWAALGQRLLEDGKVRVEIRLDGETLVAELRPESDEDATAPPNWAFLGEGRCLRLPGDDERAVGAALRASALPSEEEPAEAEPAPELDETEARLGAADTSLVTVPEPSTAPLLGAGLLALLLVARRI